MKEKYWIHSNKIQPSNGELTKKEEDGERERFSSPVAFILTCIGFAVGLGNLWRFPKLAYENGGGAFLIPYLCWSFIFGLPMLYFEFSLGQFVQKGTSKLFYMYAPAFQGIGFGMACLSAQLVIYYFLIVGWVALYMYEIVTGGWENIVSCSSPRIAAYGMNCTDKLKDNSSGVPVPAEIYFDKWIIDRSPEFSAFSEINWRLFISMLVLWLLCGLILWKGVEFMGKISYVTTVLPYIIVGILFVQGLCLEGAGEGVREYFHPNFEKLRNPKTWLDALVQMCFSLSIGFGGMPSMATYNPRNHNCFRDACLVVFADAFMSIFGGITVFSILGHLSLVKNQTIGSVVDDGTKLAFVVYPQAISQMAAPWLWGFLFFLMLALLGLSSVIVNLQSVVTCLCDLSPYLGKRKTWVNWGFCLVMFSLTILLCTKTGYYWFIIFDANVGGFALVVLILCEVLVIGYVYGIDHYKQDLYEIFGRTRSTFSRIFGPTGFYFLFDWLFAIPLLLAIICGFSIDDRLKTTVQYGTDKNAIRFPGWTSAFGWCMTFSSLLLIPIFLLINIRKARRRNEKWTTVFDPHPKHPSYARIQAEKSHLTGETLKSRLMYRISRIVY